jgi:hypothetical protein
MNTAQGVGSPVSPGMRAPLDSEMFYSYNLVTRCYRRLDCDYPTQTSWILRKLLRSGVQLARVVIKRVCKLQKSRAGIRLNKFMVLIQQGEARRRLDWFNQHLRRWYFRPLQCQSSYRGRWMAQLYPDYRERLAESDVTRKPLLEANPRMACRRSRPPRAWKGRFSGRGRTGVIDRKVVRFR